METASLQPLSVRTQPKRLLSGPPPRRGYRKRRHPPRRLRKRKLLGEWFFAAVMLILWSGAAFGILPVLTANSPARFPGFAGNMTANAVRDAAADNTAGDAAADNAEAVLTDTGLTASEFTAMETHLDEALEMPAEPMAAEPWLEPWTEAAVAQEIPWNLILISIETPLPESWQEPALTEMKSGHAVDSRVYPELQRMLDDAKAAGCRPVICSSYRSRDKQTELFANKMQSYLDQGCTEAEADWNAAFWVARPGTSEHEAGLALDIVDRKYQMLDDEQALTPAQQWLMAHCAEYGFILRYPADKTDVTGVGYEPWHYRYVGVEAAQEITQRGICLEEYLWLHYHAS